VKTNKNGLNTILSDEELKKRLINESTKPHSNCLLKRNPLILERKNFQNAQEFYQQATQCVMEVAAINKQSQMLLNSRKSHQGTHLNDHRGKDYVDTPHLALFDFLDRLRR